MLNTIFLCKSQDFVLADQVGSTCGDILAGSFSIRINLYSMEARYPGDWCERLKAYFNKLFGELWI